MKTDLEIQSRIAQIRGEIFQITSELMIVSGGKDSDYVKGREIRIMVLVAELTGLQWVRSE